jgi:F0F1-type ATP synthase assembly protein I
LVRAGRFAGAGFELAGAVGGGALIGYYVDGYFGTSPAFIVLFSLGAMVGAMYRLVRTLRKLDHREGGDGS